MSVVVGATLSARTQLTGNKQLPIPDNPYTQAAGYLLDFANTVVSNEINKKNDDEKYTTASLALNFDPQGICNLAGTGGGGFETSGTKAILMADGRNGPGFVPIDAVSDYCWKADISPAFVLKAAYKSGDKPCSDSSYDVQYKTVSNNYVAYFLQKRTSEKHLGAGQADEDIKDSRALCNLLDVEKCRAAEP